MIRKILKTIISLLVFLCIIAAYYYFQFKPAPKANFGITFSYQYAASLGLDARQVYLDMLDDLKPKKIRLVAYWEDLEPARGKFDFKNMDEMLREAEQRNVEVILALGQKVPRWPECHRPEWAKLLDEQERNKAVIEMLQNAVNHFKSSKAISSWQVENEPYFVFGLDCPKQNKEQLQKEVQTVKNLDHRPVILTASGEQGNWNEMVDSGADIVGVTMYRTVYNDRIGYYKYPIGPWFYRIKAGYLKKNKGKDVVGVELQAEPWLLSGIFHTDLDQQKSLMNQKIFKDNVEYARKTGFEDNYLWGVEWWYWMAKKQGDFGMWAAAKDLLAENE
jgi:hypothetical protein